MFYANSTLSANMTTSNERESILTAFSPTRTASPRLESAPVRVGFLTTRQMKRAASASTLSISSSALTIETDLTTVTRNSVSA